MSPFLPTLRPHKVCNDKTGKIRETAKYFAQKRLTQLLSNLVLNKKRFKNNAINNWILDFVGWTLAYQVKQNEDRWTMTSRQIERQTVGTEMTCRKPEKETNCWWWTSEVEHCLIDLTKRNLFLFRKCFSDEVSFFWFNFNWHSLLD